MMRATNTASSAITALCTTHQVKWWKFHKWSLSALNLISLLY